MKRWGDEFGAPVAKRARGGDDGHDTIWDVPDMVRSIAACLDPLALVMFGLVSAGIRRTCGSQSVSLSACRTIALETRNVACLVDVLWQYDLGRTGAMEWIHYCGKIPLLTCEVFYARFRVDWARLDKLRYYFTRHLGDLPEFALHFLEVITVEEDVHSFAAWYNSRERADLSDELVEAACKRISLGSSRRLAQRLPLIMPPYLIGKWLFRLAAHALDPGNYDVIVFLATSVQLHRKPDLKEYKAYVCLCILRWFALEADQPATAKLFWDRILLPCVQNGVLDWPSLIFWVASGHSDVQLTAKVIHRLADAMTETAWVRPSVNLEE